MSHRTTTQFASALLSTLAVILAMGCGPQVQLKHPSRHTVKQIRNLHVKDVCRLQNWFDTQPAHNTLIGQVGTAAPAKNGHAQEYGTTSYRFTDNRQKGMFMMLLARYYRLIPNIAMKNSFVVTVDFHRVAGKVRMQRNTPITLRAGTQTTHMAYHPCIAEFLLNRDLYKARKQYVVSTVVANRAD